MPSFTCNWKRTQTPSVRSSASPDTRPADPAFSSPALRVESNRRTTSGLYSIEGSTVYSKSLDQGSAHVVHHAGAPGAHARSRSTSAATRAAACSISASVVKRPTLKRSELDASASLKPMPVNTYDASGLSALHAEPAD